MCSECAKFFGTRITKNQECKTAATIECGSHAFWYDGTNTSRNYCVAARCLCFGTTGVDISAHLQLSLPIGTNCTGDGVGDQPCQQKLEMVLLCFIEPILGNR